MACSCWVLQVLELGLTCIAPVGEAMSQQPTHECRGCLSLTYIYANCTMWVHFMQSCLMSRSRACRLSSSISCTAAAALICTRECVTVAWGRWWSHPGPFLQGGKGKLWCVLLLLLPASLMSPVIQLLACALQQPGILHWLPPRETPLSTISMRTWHSGGHALRR